MGKVRAWDAMNDGVPGRFFIMQTLHPSETECALQISATSPRRLELNILLRGPNHVSQWRPQGD